VTDGVFGLSRWQDWLASIQVLINALIGNYDPMSGNATNQELRQAAYKRVNFTQYVRFI
jgi:hypothetical protein